MIVCLVNDKNLEKAVGWVEEALSNGIAINYLRRPILLALKMQLSNEGRTVPFDIPLPNWVKTIHLF